MNRLGALVVLALSGSVAQAQADPRKPPSLVDPKRVDDAIRKGVEHLRGAGSPAHNENSAVHAMRNSDELILWTLLHAGVPEADPYCRKLLAAILEAPLERTYKVALQALILEELDRVKYQVRIAQCGQFLLDNMMPNGSWSYGEPSPHANDLPTAFGRKDVPTPADAGKARDFGGAAAKRVKPKVLRKILLKKMKEGTYRGDNSNAQYAALGIRACHEAGVEFPRDALEKARDHWLKVQHAEGGDAPKGVATGAVKPGTPRGWCYMEGGACTPAYGSMTAGAIGALCIYNHLLGKEWKRDKAVLDGLAWLAHHFTVTENPHFREWHFYYLYSLERAGRIYGTEKLGTHEWYPEGATYLLGAQRDGGEWGDVPTTCFAILFLRRATRPLVDVASTDRFVPRER